jgi:hypothetical protein
MSRAHDTLDAALELLKPHGAEYGGGYANHAPMVAEALCALGREPDVIPWVERYRRQLGELPRAQREIAPEDWRSALGDAARNGDWNALMERELAEGDWRVVLDRWVARLTPGLAAAAAHGFIRSAHAARGLSMRDTPLRRRELAHGLAYWAAFHQTLPTTDRPMSDPRRPLRSSIATALARIETLRPERDTSGGFITDGLILLNDMPSFGGVIDSVDASGNPSRFLSELTEAFAHVYLANGEDSGRRVTFVHAVTGPSALRLLLPHVRPETARAALRHAWQLAAALYAAFGNPSAVARSAGDTIEIEPLIDLALESKDEHAIKMTEACLREHALNPKPVYLAAALDACRHLAS